MNLNRVCNLEDFEDEDLCHWMRTVFPYRAMQHPGFPRGQEDRKHWEIAIACLALLRGGVLRPDAELLGVGAGVEPTLFWLTNAVRRVFATDRYLDAGDWEATAPAQMLSDPGDAYKGVWRRDRLVVQDMDARDLQYEDESFDGIFSSGSIEHFGELGEIGQALDEICRVLKPGGVASMSTEFGIEGSPGVIPGLALFDREMIESIIVGDRDWELVDDLTLELSPATMATELDIALPMADMTHARDRATGLLQEADLLRSEYPHIVLRHGDLLFTSVHVALRKGTRANGRGKSVLPAERVEDVEPVEPPLASRLAAHLPEPLVAVDAGVRWGFSPTWTELLPGARLIGFDPDHSEIDKLADAHADLPGAQFVALALGSQAGRRRLNRYRAASSNSAFDHNERWLSSLDFDRSGDALEAVDEVEFTTLDAWTAEHGIDRVDVIKLDIEGAELDALAGAERVLRDVRALELEVSFNPIRAGAPLFGEVDAFLRARGFALWRLRDLAFYPVKGGTGGGDRPSTMTLAPAEISTYQSPPGLLSWCNAHFVRTDAFLGSGPPDWPVLLRDACIARALGFGDLALVALRRLLSVDAPAGVAALARAAVEEITGETAGA